MTRGQVRTGLARFAEFVRFILTGVAEVDRLVILCGVAKVDSSITDHERKQTMRTSSLALNPFSLMMEPEAVLQAMERSVSLRRLRRREMHPLDKPVIPYIKGYKSDLAEDDEEDMDEQP